MTATDLPPLRDVIQKYGLDARKALGQHFLLDLNITRKIARLADISAEHTVIEIGPGPGGLTRALLETGAQVIAIERDARCLDLLQETARAFDDRLTTVNEDALGVDETSLAQGPIKIVSNLPYNISTELLVKWLRLGQSTPEFWTNMTLMFQKEVADRILAVPGTKTYGRLSVIAQAASFPRRGMDLPARAFTPPPKVASSVVVFEPRKMDVDIRALEAVTQAAFSQRRKMLRSSLKSLLGADAEAILFAIDIDPHHRAENLSVDDFLRLAQTVSTL